MQPDSICDIMLIWVWEAKDNIWHNGASLILLISNSNGKAMTTFPKHSSCLSLVSQKNSSALNSRDWMSQMSLKHCVTLNTAFKLNTKKKKKIIFILFWTPEHSFKAEFMFEMQADNHLNESLCRRHLIQCSFELNLHSLLCQNVYIQVFLSAKWHDASGHAHARGSVHSCLTLCLL